MLKYILLSLFFLVKWNHNFSQKYTNIIYTSGDTMTTDVKIATGFIVLQEFSENKFVRLDYKIGSSVTRLMTFNDSNLVNLDGPLIEYNNDGFIKYKANYVNNLRNGKWVFYDDSGIAIANTYYTNDKLIKEDYLPKKKHRDSTEIEANFRGGEEAWQLYLQDKMTNSTIVEEDFNSGTVIVSFVVDTLGEIKDIHLIKSSEYILDMFSISMIQQSPKWIPGTKNGIKIEQTLTQPFSYKKQ